MATESHDSWKIGVPVGLVLLTAIFVLACLISPTKEEGYFTCIILIACAAAGWVVGMMLSPDSKVEEQRLHGLWKGVSLFVSGYLISKIDPLIAMVLSPESILNSPNHITAFRLIGGVAVIIISALIVYILRVYAWTVGE